MKVNIEKTDSFVGAWKKGWGDSDEGVWSTTKGVLDANRQYASHHKIKTAVVAGTFLAVTLTAAYFTSPAYAAGVAAFGVKAAALVSPAITAVSAFLVAHPLIATFAIIASVAALIAAPLYAYVNNSKSNQIDAVKEEILNSCEKDGGKLKLTGDASTFLNGVAVAVGLAPAQAK